MLGRLLSLILLTGEGSSRGLEKEHGSKETLRNQHLITDTSQVDPSSPTSLLPNHSPYPRLPWPTCMWHLRLQCPRGHQLRYQHNASLALGAGLPEVIEAHDVRVL